MNSTTNAATPQMISALDLVVDAPNQGVLLVLPGFDLSVEMNDGDQFEGTVSLQFPDGKSASYEAVFEVLPERDSVTADVIARQLGALIRCEENGQDLVGAAYAVRISRRLEGFKLQQ